MRPVIATTISATSLFLLMKSGNMEGKQTWERRPTDLIVVVKNSGKSVPVQVDVNASATDFKQSISTATGVPIGKLDNSGSAGFNLTSAERMKVMVKGGILKVRPRSRHRLTIRMMPT